MSNQTIYPKELKNPKEIISHLTHACLNQQEAVIWRRNLEGEIRLNEKVKLLKILDGNQLRVEFERDLEREEGKEVFFALENGKLVFKSSIGSILGRKAVLALPTIAKGIERRRSPRKPFKYEDRIDFEIALGYTERCTAFLLDLSVHGLCLSLTDETVKRLHVDQELTFSRTNAGVNHTKCIVRSIRIFRPAKLGRNALYAVGLEFLA